MRTFRSIFTPETISRLKFMRPANQVSSETVSIRHRSELAADGIAIGERERRLMVGGALRRTCGQREIQHVAQEKRRGLFQQRRFPDQQIGRSAIPTSRRAGRCWKSGRRTPPHPPRRGRRMRETEQENGKKPVSCLGCGFGFRGGSVPWPRCHPGGTPADLTKDGRRTPHPR